MLGLYFSGTGNTRYCVETFVSAYDSQAEALSIEDPRLEEELPKHRELVLGYPIQYSCLPKLVHDYLLAHRAAWAGKDVFLIATMGLFSGDGTGVAARLLEPCGARVTGGLHLKMPDSICDVKALKRAPERDRALVRQAGERAREAAAQLRAGTPPRDGLGSAAHLAGLFGQRLYFGHKTRSYTDKLRVDPKRCTDCGQCAALCPMGNLSLAGGRAQAGARCTMCYRCINHCPGRAITLLGREVVRQSLVEHYL